MKKDLLRFALFPVLALSLFSCKKADNSSPYYIKGKIDGSSFNFTTNAIATVSATGRASIVSFTASGTGIEGFNIGLNFYSGNALETGIYSEDNAGSNYSIAGVYNPNSTTMVYSAGIQPSANPLVINVLSKTATEISGTFSGAFYRQTVSGTFYPEYKTITEGEFKLQLK